MITTVQCSIPSQLNNKPRVVVTDFRLHHTCIPAYLQYNNSMASLTNSGWLRLYKIFQEAAPPISDLRLMCHLLNNCSLYMSIIFIYF